MERIRGRTDDMLIIRGVNVFPSQIEAAIMRVADLEPQYVIVVDRQKSNLDTIEVRIEAKEDLWVRGDDARQAAAKQVRDEVHEIIGISIDAKIAEPRSIQRSEGKAKRVYDLREI
jgi:phenylacetate-CoA ligase